MRRALFVGLTLVATGLAVAAEPSQRTLTFEDRVKAQEEIERVYYSHQIGTTKPFEQAVARSVLEGKVRKYLGQTAALKVYWKTSVTDEILQRELERMAHGTRMPERLLELYSALGNDSFLIKECLARATLVDRLTRNFYAFDSTLHVEARKRAEELHRQLSAGELSAFADHSNRSVYELVTRESGSESLEPRELEDRAFNRAGPLRQRLTADEFRMQRAQLPDVAGRVSAIKEERESFSLRVVLSETPTETRVANYNISKTPWDLWWNAAMRSIQRETVAAVASDASRVPAPARVRLGERDAAGPVVIGLPCAPDDTWDDPMTLSNAPDPRDRHSVVWTGSLMVIWGGFRSSTVLSTGGRYDPATDSWTSTSLVGALSGRYSHTAVWTGNVMLVWGGNGGAFPNTGGRYDPIADVWAPMSTAGAPSGRYFHAAVWTGTVMVVWGGYGGGTFDTGGRYDPATDSWTATSMIGAPSRRDRFAAIWTGTVMVVWGGYDGAGGYLGTGGRYDPAMDTWAATSVTGAPSPRWFHSAVWSGSEVVVWGGDNGNTFSTTGGRYNPTTNAWTATSTAGVPAGRRQQTAVWTGSEVVVWGGASGGGVNTGGRYNPATNSWTATSTAQAPAARYDHTAVWTGSLMVVWGGQNVGGQLNTGGRYVLGATVDNDGDGYTECQADCNDDNPSVRPGGAQLCDGVNNDCSDPNWPAVPPNEADSDHDGYRICVGDCNDTQASEYPGAPQLCDGVNNNCSDPSWPTVPANEANADADSFRICQGDCNDTDSAVYPSAPQLCDGKNNNCSDATWPTVPVNETDADGDGFRICQNDCNDTNPNVRPNAVESCNGTDDNCNGPVDEDASGVDSDSDSIHNACDNCRFAFNPDQLDSDGDLVGSACDNCLTRVNPGQEDLDADQRGDACDNCVAAYNPLQDDSDVDRRGDACDNCVFDFNPSQTNFDHDGEGDLCDLNDGLIYVYSTDRDYREWQSESGFTAWNSYRGSLAVLRATGQYAQAPGSNPLAARDCGVSDPYVFDPLVPNPGEVAFNLVTGMAGGVESSLGTNSAGVPRANANPCP